MTARLEQAGAATIELHRLLFGPESELDDDSAFELLARIVAAIALEQCTTPRSVLEEAFCRVVDDETWEQIREALAADGYRPHSLLHGDTDRLVRQEDGG